MTDRTHAPERGLKNDGSNEAKMTHLVSYEGPRGQEIRLSNAEFRGEHYLDFRFYEKRSRGAVPTKRGIRLGLRSIEYLEDAISRWKAFLEVLEAEIPSRDTYKAPSGKSG